MLKQLTKLKQLIDSFYLNEIEVVPEFSPYLTVDKAIGKQKRQQIGLVMVMCFNILAMTYTATSLKPYFDQRYYQYKHPYKSLHLTIT